MSGSRRNNGAKRGRRTGRDEPIIVRWPSTIIHFRSVAMCPGAFVSCVRIENGEGMFYTVDHALFQHLLVL
jgi:hypothetical protein